MRLWGDTGGYCGKGFGHVVDSKYTQTNIHAKGTDGHDSRGCGYGTDAKTLKVK